MAAKPTHNPPPGPLRALYDWVTGASPPAAAPRPAIVLQQDGVPTRIGQMATGRKPVSHATGLLQRTIVKWIALYVPLPWPGGRIVTRPEIDQQRAGTKPGDFAADVAELEALMRLVTSLSPTFSWPPHPIFGRMSEADWMRWGYLHMDHHLRQFGA